MDFDLTWILLGLPLAFVAGWLASRVDLRQLRLENRQAPKAYFKGLNYLLNEQQDQAIDAFIEAVQNDPDTSELHFALGNLFRRRGEYERAVRVHQHLLSRGDLKEEDRQRAQHALALDYLKAGLLDRAEDALRKLEGTSFEAQARLARLAIYERSRDWPMAADIAARLQQSGQGQFDSRLAHYLCEQAQALLAAGEREQADSLLRKAMVQSPASARAYTALAAMQREAGQAAQGLETLLQLLRLSPSAWPLAAGSVAELALGSPREADVLALLKTVYQSAHSLDVLDAIVRLDNAQAQPEFGRQWYVRHLSHEPSLVAATRWLAGETLEQERYHAQVQQALDHAVKPLTRYRCAACGFEARQYFWQCPGCQAWDSFPPRRVEEL